MLLLLAVLGAVRPASADAPALREQAAQQSRRGEMAALGQTLQRLVAQERSPRNLNDLGLWLSDQGESAAAAALLAEAAAQAPADQRGLYQANQALNLRRQFRDGEAQALLQRALSDIEQYRGPTGGWRACNLQRSRAVALIQLSRIEERQGHLQAALAHAVSAQQAAAQALQLLPPQATAAEAHWAAADLANAHRREVHVLIQAQPTAQAEQADQALARWEDVATRHAQGPVVRAQIRAAAAQLALSRQHFDEAADADYADAGFAAHHLARVALLETRLAALWARQRAPEALALLAALDTSVDQATAAGARPDAAAVQMPLLRGLVLLDAGHPAEAATLFETQSRRVPESPGLGRLWHAEAIGLQGVALHGVQSGDAAAQARASALLAQAVTVLTDPLSAAEPDGSGLRALIRRRVVQAHVASQLDAAAPPDLRTAALLDWVSDGAVQRAVTQAAARMAITDPALRELVRQEQNLRRAVDALARGATPGYGLGMAGDEDTRPRAGNAADGLVQLASLRERWAEVANQLRARYPDFAGLVQPMPLPLERVQQALAPDEALLVIASQEQDTLLWLLQHDGRSLSRRVALPRARTEALVAALRNSLELPSNGRLPAFDRRSAGELHRLLIEPLREALVGVKHLAVVTNGPLATLPLAVLAPDDGRPAREADWLVRRSAISQTTSLAAWLAARRTVAAASDTPLTMLGWGDPQFGNAGDGASAPRRGVISLPRTKGEPPDPRTAFPSLPETRDELLAIARALGADPERSLRLGPQATRSSVLEASRSGRLSQARIIAFATHGLKAGEWPGLEQPALVMAWPEQGAAVQDPSAHMLSLDDTLSLDLNADWVVLSACNTTAGDREAGEALSGLARGMFYAGARSLLATHWAVESTSAARLVSETFRAYASPARPGKAEALRQAMLSVLSQPGMTHPFYWAPYVVIGDGER